MFKARQKRNMGGFGLSLQVECCRPPPLASSRSRYARKPRHAESLPGQRFQLLQGQDIAPAQVEPGDLLAQLAV